MSQLENAILNLAVNARDAMPGGGNLTIETANTELDERYSRMHSEVEAGQYVMVSITDTGTGMSPEVIERAFDPFYTTKDPAKAPGSVSARSMVTSNRAAATSRSIQRSTGARR